MKVLVGFTVIPPDAIAIKLVGHAMLADDNPYAAPQAALITLNRALPVEDDRTGFPWALVRQGLRNGAVAGIISSVVMLFVFLLRLTSGSDGEISNLLATCGCFMVATSSCGMFWGFNHALIVWCLRRWRPESWTKE